MLNQLHGNLWEYHAPMRVLGMHLGHRMTVLRLGDGTLWVHSPVAYTDALAAELHSLGPVGHIVAPNYMHDTFLEGWIPRYPAARFHAPKGFAKVFPDYPTTDVLGNQPDAAWSGVLEQHVVQGVRRVHEVVFFHAASRSLLVADLAFNLGPEMPLLSRVLLRINDCYCRFGPSRMFKVVIDDRVALRKSIDRILRWDFERIIVGHGEILTDSPKDALRTAFAFLD